MTDAERDRYSRQILFPASPRRAGVVTFLRGHCRLRAPALHAGVGGNGRLLLIDRVSSNPAPAAAVVYKERREGRAKAGPLPALWRESIPAYDRSDTRPDAR
jgi:hypothetical protein